MFNSSINPRTISFLEEVTSYEIIHHKILLRIKNFIITFDKTLYFSKHLGSICFPPQLYCVFWVWWQFFGIITNMIQKTRRHGIFTLNVGECHFGFHQRWEIGSSVWISFFQNIGIDCSFVVCSIHGIFLFKLICNTFQKLPYLISLLWFMV